MRKKENRDYSIGNGELNRFDEFKKRKLEFWRKLALAK